MKLILSLCSIALFSSCSDENTSAGTGPSVKFTLTPITTLTNTSVVAQSATLNSDQTGTLVVSENGTSQTFSFDYTGDASVIKNGDKATVIFSTGDTPTPQVSRSWSKIQPQVGGIKSYVKFIFQGAYYSIKAYFKHTDQVGGSTLAQAIDDRPQDMRYNGVPSITASALCDQSTLSIADTATLKICCDPAKQEDPKIFNDPTCQSYRASLGSSSPTTTAPCSCVILYQTNFSLTSRHQIPASWTSGAYTATYGSKTCTGTTCSTVGACLKPTIEAAGYSYIDPSCN